MKNIMSFQQQPPRLVRWGLHPLSSTPVIIGITEKNVLCLVVFTNGRKPSSLIKEWQKKWPRTQFVEDQKATAKIAAEISKGHNDVQLQLTGTPFQQAVWKQLLKIPSGKTLSYAEVAKRIKRPKAIRAVGTACGANPIPIVVPCHRVVASNGKLGGFGGGLPLKKILLQSEGVNPETIAA
jgi:O-6-methylguanine DNA methyltransferase